MYRFARAPLIVALLALTHPGEAAAGGTPRRTPSAGQLRAGFVRAIRANDEHKRDAAYLKLATLLRPRAETASTAIMVFGLLISNSPVSVNGPVWTFNFIVGQ